MRCAIVCFICKLYFFQRPYFNVFIFFNEQRNAAHAKNFLRAPHSVFKKYPAAKYSGTKINQDP